MAYDDRETGLTVEDRGSKLGLPQNQDAEANVLAAMLLSPEVVEEAQVELTDRGKIKPRRVTGACTQHQHDIANAIKRAREMALLPYTVPVVSSRGNRDRG